MKKLILSVSGIILIFFNVVCFATPRVLLKNADNIKENIAITTLPTAINTFIKNIILKQPDLYQMVVYQFNHYDVIYLLSGKYWSVQKIRINLDGQNNITSVINPYQSNAKETKIVLNGMQAPQYPACPDPSVQFVAISAYPDLGNVKKAIETVYAAASKQYKSVEILGNTATAENYTAWLSCPNLKGFYSIGHGDNTEIFVANGESIPYIIFHDKQFTYKYLDSHTILAFNSCDVFNNPFGTEMGFGNAYTVTDYAINPGPLPAVFLGGYLELLIGASENTSSCFIVQGLSGKKMDYATLQDCVNGDFYYGDFGLSYPSQNFKK